MSFVHYELVGHIDPRDPIEFGRPSRPKVLRPIDPQAVSRVLKSLPKNIEHIVDVAENGCVYLLWSADLSIPCSISSQFLRRVADDTGAVVMSQYFQIWYPDSAKAEYEANLDELGRRWQEYCRENPRNERR